MKRALEARDLEILRALARLHFLSSAEICSTFFPTPDPGWRRIKRYVDWNLIVEHTRPYPARSSVWRLTSQGFQCVQDEFPRELIPSGMAERLAAQQLSEPEHRNALACLYLALVRGAEGPEDGGKGALRLWMAEVRQRADRFAWRADGTLVLEWHEGGEAMRLHPDATLESRAKRQRLFVELDRSTKTLSRIRENLQRYARYLKRSYAVDFSDGMEPAVVYVVRSEHRRDHIAEIAAQELGAAVASRVLVYDGDAVPWLAAQLFDEERPLPVRAHGSALPAPLVPPQIRTAAQGFIDATRALLTSPEIKPVMRAANPNLLAQWTERLSSLHALIKES